MNDGKKPSTIAVIGAGAIGGITAAFLQKDGLDVELVSKHKEVTDRINSTGLHVFGLRGEEMVRLKAVKEISDLSGKKDLVLLATKATECLEAARELLPFLHEDSRVVSLQNGICETALADILGEHRVIGCVVGWSASMFTPGELELTNEGEFIIGSINSSNSGQLEPIQEILQTVMPTRISEDIMAELYSKLVLNACMNSPCVVTGLDLSPLLKQKNGRKLFIGIMREAMAVANAAGIQVPTGRLNYTKLLNPPNILGDIKRSLFLRLMAAASKKVKVSSMQSVARRRKTEVDFLNGYISDLGRSHQVPTPLNDAMVAMVKEIENGTRTMSLDNLNIPEIKNPRCHQDTISRPNQFD